MERPSFPYLKILKPAEIGIFATQAVGAVAHSQLLSHKPDLQIDPASLIGRFAYNGGDFPDGYLIPTAVDWAMRVSFNGVLFREMPINLRRGISAAIGIGSVIVAETVNLPSKSFGKPDLEDIPAGLMGVACYLGVSLWLWNNHKQSVPYKELLMQNS